jgi:ketosteroid isomerase-like protein
MTTIEETPYAIARRYHDAWSTQRFDDAIELLDEELRVEVPVNDYPTRASFAQALAAFGSMIEEVELLSALAGTDEAMLLYDMKVRGIGALRVAEHFTMRDGRIVSLRQIHDTAPIRAAGLVP